MAAKHRHRVIDFPTDETALLGSGAGGTHGHCGGAIREVLGVLRIWEHWSGTPYLSSSPKGLIALLTAMSSKMEGQKLLPTAKAPSLLFADLCKELLASFPAWQIVGAQATYNPLGQMVTFLSKDDIISKADRLSAIREGA